MEVGAAAVALQLLRVAIIMAALTEARLTGEAVGSVPEVALETAGIMLAGPRNIGADAVKPLDWPLCAETRCWTPLLPYWRLHEFFQILLQALRDD